MALEIYKGGGIPRGECFVTIEPSGRAYLSAAIVKQLPRNVTRMQFGYDRATGEAALCPSEDDGGAAYKLRGGHGRVLNFLGALKYFDLLPQVVGRHAASYEGGMIWFRATEAAAVPDEQPIDREADKVPTLDEAIDFEDGRDCPPGETATRRGSKGRCETCFYRRAGFCDNGQSPQYGLAVGAANRCDRHVRNPQAVKKSVGIRRRGYCAAADHDGKDFAVTSKGVYPHDVEGICYSRGHGDRERPCPGSGQSARQ